MRVGELFGLTGRTVSTAVPELLPGDSRQVEAHVGGVWGLGRYSTTVEVTPAVVTGDPADAQVRPTTVTVTGWTVPWPQLVFGVLVGILLLGWLAIARRRRRRLARMLDQARAEGRESVLAAD